MLWAHCPRSIEQDDEVRVSWYRASSPSNRINSYTPRTRTMNPTHHNARHRMLLLILDLLWFAFSQWFLPQTSRLRRNLLPPFIHEFQQSVISTPSHKSQTHKIQYITTSIHHSSQPSWYTSTPISYLWHLIKTLIYVSPRYRAWPRGGEGVGVAMCKQSWLFRLTISPLGTSVPLMFSASSSSRLDHKMQCLSRWSG